MSQENVDAVVRLIDLFNEGRIDEAFAGVAESVEMDWSNSIGPLKGVYRGKEGVRTLWQTFLDAWETVRWDPREMIDVDESRVVVVNRVRMRGRGSGVDVDATGVQVWTFEGGSPVRIKLYQTRSEALDAVGLDA
jgi:ketosteroid isomerase-like protein